MEPIYINAFVRAIQNVFSTMFRLPIEIGEPQEKPADAARQDVSGIIGVSGSIVGTIVLSMPFKSADAITMLFTDRRLETDSPDYADAVGEIVNMICGGAKASFQREDVLISCPTVVIGPGHFISQLSGTECVQIPCKTDCGEVILEVALRGAYEQPAMTNHAA